MHLNTINTYKHHWSSIFQDQEWPDQQMLADMIRNWDDFIDAISYATETDTAFINQLKNFFNVDALTVLQKTINASKLHDRLIYLLETRGKDQSVARLKKLDKEALSGPSDTAIAAQKVANDMAAEHFEQDSFFAALEKIAKDLDDPSHEESTRDNTSPQKNATLPAKQIQETDPTQDPIKMTANKKDLHIGHIKRLIASEIKSQIASVKTNYASALQKEIHFIENKTVAFCANTNNIEISSATLKTKKNSFLKIPATTIKQTLVLGQMGEVEGETLGAFENNKQTCKANLLAFIANQKALGPFGVLLYQAIEKIPFSIHQEIKKSEWYKGKFGLYNGIKDLEKSVFDTETYASSKDSPLKPPGKSPLK